MVLDRQGDHQGALENYRASLNTILDAMAADPSVDPGRGAEMKYRIVVGRALCKLGQKEEGIPLLRRGVETTLNLVESEKGNQMGKYYSTEMLSWAVDGMAAAGLRDEAKSLSLKMIDRAEEAVNISPNDGGPRLRLAVLYEQLGDVYAGYDANAHKLATEERARLAEAHDSYQKALDSLRRIGPDFRVSQSILEEHSNPLEEKISQCNARLSGQQGNSTEENPRFLHSFPFLTIAYTCRPVFLVTYWSYGNWLIVIWKR